MANDTPGGIESPVAMSEPADTLSDSSSLGENATMLTRIGRWSFRRRWAVLITWLLLLIAVWAVAGSVGSAFNDALEVPDSETKEGFDLIEEHFDGVGGGISGSIVFAAEQGINDPAIADPMQEMIAEADAIGEPGDVTIVSPYASAGALQVTDDETLAFATVELDPDVGETDAGEIGQELRELKPDVEGLDVLIGGQGLSEFEPPEAELIGIAFAIVILIVAFGSVVAMGVPIGVAIVGVGTGLGVTTLATNGLTIPQFAPTIGAMIGLGVGIDYALFILTRYREHLHLGETTINATGHALDTAGRAVLFAGLTVVVSLLGLLVVGLSFVTGLAVSAAITVLCTMLASITLLPALLGFVNERIETTRWRGLVAAGFVAVALLGVGLGIQPLMIGLPIAIVILVAGTFIAPLRKTLPRRPPKPRRETFWYKLSRVIQARPWTAALGGTLLLLILAVPVLGIRLGFSDEGNAQESTDYRQAYDLLSEGFGAGFNGPLLITVDLNGTSDFENVLALGEALTETDGVAQVSPPFPSDLEDPTASGAALIRVTPETSPQSEETEDLIERLRTDVIPPALAGSEIDAHITGFTAASVDFSDYLSGRTLMFFGVVLVLSFVLLMMVFRSLLVPLKAVIMNMLSIAAAYGVTVAVFQWGWGDVLLDTSSGAPIEPFIPMMMFAVVFGLSMDYEVFLISRIKEEYDYSGDAVESVADGLAATARVISAAAAIMIVVFGSFVLDADRVIRLFGFGLAVAVLLDATLVRMVLVPATMELLGEKNWWIPKWLDRILPNIQVEGRADVHPPSDEPDGDSSDEAEQEPVLTS